MRRANERRADEVLPKRKGGYKMSFIKIDMETWPRKEHYQYYTTQLKTSYQVNVNLDVTELRQFCKERKLRFYPMMIYYIMKVINEIPAFRMAVNEKGELGYYDVSHPQYTIFHEDDCTFSDIWTYYDDDREKFYRDCVQDMENCKDIKGVKAKAGCPQAFTCISCVPWLHFTGVSHDTPGPGPFYVPVITFGKYEEKTGRYEMPFSVFINHAVADGYHTSMLINRIQEEISHP